MLPVLMRVLKSKFVLKTDDAGNHTLLSPHFRALLLAGGGVKGISYVGMLKALIEHDIMHNISHISGNSAGAMVASFIAIGMNQIQIETLVCGLDLNNIWNRESGSIGLRSNGLRLENIFNAIYLMQIKIYLKDMPENKIHEIIDIKSKVDNFDAAMANANLTNYFKDIDGIISLSKSAVDLLVFDRVLSGQQNFCHLSFSDLKLLRNLLFDGSHLLIKNLVVAVTDTSLKRLKFFGENHDPMTSIAFVVHASGAHPALFDPVPVDSRFLSDGGLVDNMPIEPLLKAGLGLTEIMCIMPESNMDYEAKLKKLQSHKPILVSKFGMFADYGFLTIFGAPAFANQAALARRQQVCFRHGILLVLNTHELSVLAVSASNAQKNVAITASYLQTKDFLNKRNLSESSLILALLQLDISVLDDIISSETSSIEMKKIARIAHAIYGLQESMLLLVADSSVTLAELQGQINAIDTHLADLNLGAAELVCVRELWRSQVDHASKARFSSRLESLQQEPEPNLSGFAWLWQWLCGLVTYIIGIFKGVDNLELNEGSNFVYP